MRTNISGNGTDDLISAKHSLRKDRIACILPAMAYISLGILSLLEVLSFRVGDLNKAIFSISTLLALSYVFFLGKVKFNWYIFISTVLVTSSIWLFVGLDNFPSLYYFSDSLLIVLCFSWLLFLGKRDAFLQLPMASVCIFFVTFAFFLLNWWLGFEKVNERFPSISPYVFIMFILSYQFFSMGSINRLSPNIIRVIVLCIWVIVLSGVLFSGDRTSFVIIFLAGVAYFYSENASISRIVSTITLGGAFSLIFFMEYLPVQNFRVGSVLSVLNDHSFMQRVYEAKDIFHYVWSSFNEGEWEWLFGFGPGAVFEPIYSYSERNILPSGEVHHIHSTPFLFLYRFGILFAIVWVLFLGLVFYKGLCVFKRTKNYLILILVFLLLIDQLLRNVLVNPWYFIACSFLFFFRKWDVYER